MMTYLGELKHFQLNQFDGSELLTFNEKRKLLKDSAKRKRESKSKLFWWKEVCHAYWKLYCDKASIHGIRFLTDNNMLKFEKIIWAIILITTTIVCGYVYKLLSERYRSPRIHTIVEDSVLPVFFIPFPSIAICPRYRFNWSKMPAAEAKFLPLNPPHNTTRAFREFFQRFEEFQFGKFEYFENLEDLQLELINNVSIIDVMRFLTYTCDELFGIANGTTSTSSCLWRKRVYNCCELFKLERTEVGFCQVFNSVILPEMRWRAKRDKFYPFRNSKSGEKSGLQVKIHLNISEKRPEAQVSDGIYVMVKKNDQWSSDWKYINGDTYARVAITPQFTDSLPEIRPVAPDERKCLFDDEVQHRLYKKIQGLKYWRSNCRTQCHHEYVISYCNCTLPLLFPDWDNTSFLPCSPKDFMCLYENRDVFVSERHRFEDEFIDNDNVQMLCSCMNSCDSLVFSSSVITFIKPPNRTEVQVISLDVFYNMDYMPKYLTILSYTYVELIGNFGGIIGLFLGASLLSAVEFIYYFTIGFAVYVRKVKIRRNRIQIKKANVKVVKPKNQEGNVPDSRKILRQRF